MTTQQEEIYFGIRGQPFKELIQGLLRQGKLKPKYISVLTNDKNMLAYGDAFTAASADAKSNYEIYEQLGDLVVNQFIVWYSLRRFYQLNCPLGVKVLARLRINYGSKDSLSEIGEELGFWDYISAKFDGPEKNVKYRSRNKKDLLEDCVEAFIGCTAWLLDQEFRPGVGYAIAYDILASIFDKKDMSLRYTDLYDDKTRLKELFDSRKNLGNLEYIDTREEDVAHSSVYQRAEGSKTKRITVPSTDGRTVSNACRIYPAKIVKPGRGWILLGTGAATRKDKAQQNAAHAALKSLKRDGIWKAPPPEYQLFCTE